MGMVNKYEMQNPLVLVIGNEFYNDATQTWQSLRGVVVDVTKMDFLWSGLYEYNTNILFSPRERNKEEIDELYRRGIGSAKYDRNFFRHGISKKCLSNFREFDLYLDNIVEKMSSKYDGLILCYSGHGINGNIILANGDEYPIYSRKRSKYPAIYTNIGDDKKYTGIEDKFGDNCGQLVGKPKIMIFDCCVGEEPAVMRRQESDHKINYSNRRVLIDHQRVNTLNIGYPRANPGREFARSFHSDSGFGFIFANSTKFTINDDPNGGHLTNSVCQVLMDQAQRIFESNGTHSGEPLRDLILHIRRETKNKAGSGCPQLVVFSEALEYRLYFGIGLDR